MGRRSLKVDEYKVYMHNNRLRLPDSHAMVGNLCRAVQVRSDVVYSVQRAVSGRTVPSGETLKRQG